MAIRVALRAGYDAADARVRRQPPRCISYPACEESYQCTVIRPARDLNLLEDEEAKAWGKRLSCGQAIGDPRIQAFLAAMSERIALYRSSPADLAHRAIAEWLGKPLNAVRPCGTVVNSHVTFQVRGRYFFGVPIVSDPFVPAGFGEMNGESASLLPTELGTPQTTYHSKVLRSMVTRTLFGDLAIYEVHDPDPTLTG